MTKSFDDFIDVVSSPFGSQRRFAIQVGCVSGFAAIACCITWPQPAILSGNILWPILMLSSGAITHAALDGKWSNMIDKLGRRVRNLLGQIVIMMIAIAIAGVIFGISAPVICAALITALQCLAAGAATMDGTH